MIGVRRLLFALCAAAALAAGSADLTAAAGDLPETHLAATVASPAEAALDKDRICTRCHDDTEQAPVLTLYQSKHGVRGDRRTPTCQSCHGESAKHLQGDANVKGRAPTDVSFKKGVYPLTDERTRTAQCLACHEGTQRIRWEGGAHETNQVACNDCHKVHQPVDRMVTRASQAEVCFTCHKEQRAEVRKVSTHPIAVGKVVCSDCHNPHGSAGPKLMKKNTVTETCFTCHAKQRGPFLWEHQPVNEDCTICHTPHGSNQAPLLKSRGTILCQECHDGPHNSKTPVGPNAGSYQAGFALSANPSTQAVGRGCMNCHQMVHGSNSPSGAFLQR